MSTRATILIANDHEWTARSLETILGAEGYFVVRAFTADQALERALSFRPAACIFDVQLPDADGMTLCRRIHERLGSAIPVILTTAGPSGRQERMAAYRAGAWEFFGQPLDGEILLLKLKVYLEAKAVTDEYRDESFLDEATGLYSRRGLLHRGREAVADAARRHRSIACVVFRPESPETAVAIAAAESLAQAVARLLRATGRSADAIGRVGPLDFGLIAVGIGEPEVQQLVRRITEAAMEKTVNGTAASRLVLRSAYRTVESAAVGTVDLDVIMREAVDAVAETGVEPSSSVRP